MDDDLSPPLWGAAARHDGESLVLTLFVVTNNIV